MGIADTTTGLSSKALARLRRAVVVLLLGNALAFATHEGATSTSPVPLTSPDTVGAASSDSAPATEAPPSTSTTAAPTREATKGAGKRAPTATTEPPASIDATFPVMSEGMNYELTLTPTCARPGEPFTATMRLQAKWGTGGVLMPFYADGSYEKGKSGFPEPDGTVTYTWVARPVPGEGRLVTQAGDSETGEKGTKIVAFRVVPVGGSC